MCCLTQHKHMTSSITLNTSHMLQLVVANIYYTRCMWSLFGLRSLDPSCHLCVVCGFFIFYV